MPSSIRSLLVTSFALLATCGAEENIVDPTQSGSQNHSSAEIASVTALTPELGSFGIDLSHQDLSISERSNITPNAPEPRGGLDDLHRIDPTYPSCCLPCR